MKKEELFEVLGNLEPGMVEKARSDRHPRRGVWKKWTAAAACAVIIGGAVLGVATWRNGREGSAVRYPSGVTTVLAAYPASVERTMDAQKFMESDAHWDWWDSYRELTAKSAELQSGMDAYYQNLMKQMLVSEDENTGYPDSGARRLSTAPSPKKKAWPRNNGRSPLENPGQGGGKTTVYGK